MKSIFVIRGTLTFFGNLGGDIDTIGSTIRRLCVLILILYLYYFFAFIFFI
jgi:hypothetical protein